jgi:hypothetical protein
VANSLAFDERSSVVSVTDEVHIVDNGSTIKSMYDAVYTHDDLGRLVKAESGNMVSAAI